jgi:tRNA (guanine37-N1)-methyltransferase
VLIDAVVRLIPGALGHEDSAAEDSFAVRAKAESRSQPGAESEEDDGQRLLDCPHYTRPRVWRGREVPDVLLSGDHQAVAKWRMESMLERTRERRPDMLQGELKAQE